MSNYHIRLSWSYDELKPFTQRISDNSSQCIVYQHTEQARIHIHIWVKNITQSTDTMKLWIKDCLKIKRVNRDQWAFTTCNKHKIPWTDELITYLTKGKLEPSQVKGFTEEEIVEYKEKWIDHTEPAIDNKDGSKHTASKITTWFLAKELAQYIDTTTMERLNNPDDHSLSQLNQDTLTTRDIIYKAIQIHNKYEKSYCDFSLTKVIQTAFGICKNDRWTTELINSVYNRIIPRNIS